MRLPIGWEEATVSEVVDILDSRRVPLNSEERGQRKGPIPYWGANGIVDYIDDHIFDEPLVLMAEDGGYFAEARTRPICHKLDGKAWVNNHAHVIRPVGVERDWFYYWFVHRDITPHIKGGTRSKLNQKDLRQLPIFVPPFPEQRRIAEILSSVDETIQATQAVIEQTRKVRQGVLERLLTKGIGHTNFKQTEIGEIPDGWDIRRLDELTLRGEGVTYGVVQPGPEEISGVKFIRGGDFPNGTIEVERLRTIKKETSERYKRTILHGGEVLVSLVGRPGSCAVVPKELCGANVARQVAMIRLKDVMNPYLLRSYLLCPIGKKELFKHTIGSVQQVINLADLKTVLVPVPPVREQEKIVSMVSALLQADDAVLMKLKQLTVLKTALMSDLVTGRKRIVVQDLVATE